MVAPPCFYTAFAFFFISAISAFFFSIISARSFSHSSLVFAYTLNFFLLPSGSLGKKLPSHSVSFTWYTHPVPLFSNYLRVCVVGNSLDYNSYLVANVSIAICIPNLNAYSKMAASALLMYSPQQFSTVA